MHKIINTAATATTNPSTTTSSSSARNHATVAKLKLLTSSGKDEEFNLISSQPKVTHFKIRLYSDLFYKIKNEGILDEYDEIALKDLVKTIQINLKLDQFIQALWS